jgi:hypothetical protein
LVGLVGGDQVAVSLFFRRSLQQAVKFVAALKLNIPPRKVAITTISIS